MRLLIIVSIMVVSAHYSFGQAREQETNSADSLLTSGVTFEDLERENGSSADTTYSLESSGVSVIGHEQKLQGVISDSLAQIDFLNKVDSLSSKISDLKAWRSSQQWSSAELESKATQFLEENDDLIRELQEKQGGLKQSPQVKKALRKSEKVQRDVASIRSWRPTQLTDTLGHVEKALEIRQAIDREGLEKVTADKKDAFLEDQREHLQNELLAKNEELAAATNMRKWPLSKEYYESRVLGYFEQYDDSVSNKVDSVTHYLQPPLVQAEVLRRGAKDQIDSLTNASIDEAWLKMKSTKVAEDVEAIKVKHREFRLWKPDYSELIVGLNEQDRHQLLLSPSVAHELFRSFYVGLGGEVTMHLRDMKSSVIGFKGLVRYHPKDAFYYLQGESVSYFPGVSFDRSGELSATVDLGYQHAINLGVGVLYPINKWLDVNGAVLYRVMEATVTPNASPFIFRLGFTIK